MVESFNFVEIFYFVITLAIDIKAKTSMISDIKWGFESGSDQKKIRIRHAMVWFLNSPLHTENEIFRQI